MPCVNARRCGIFSIFISDVFHPSRYESKRENKEGKKGKIKGGLKRGDESPRSSKLIHLDSIFTDSPFNWMFWGMGRNESMDEKAEGQVGQEERSKYGGSAEAAV